MNDPWAEFRVQAQADPWAEFRAPAQPAQAAPAPTSTRYGNVPAPSWVPAPIAGAVDWLGGLTRQGQRALTFGMLDEATAGANAGAAAAAGQPAGPAYDAALAETRGQQQAFEQDNPAASIAAQVVGGAAFPLPGRGAASMGGAIVRGAATGGAMGATAGFGEGEGGAANRLASGIMGGVVGGAIGGAAPPVLSTLGGAVSGATRRLGLSDPDATGQRVVLRSLARDGVTPEEVATRLQQAGGAPVMMSDVAGESTRGTAAAVARVPGVGQSMASEAVQARGGAAQGARLAESVRAGVSPDDFVAGVQTVAQRQRAVAAPAYDRAYAATLPDDPRLGRFLSDPDIRTGLRAGLESARREALTNDVPFDPAALGVRIANDGAIEMIPGGTPTRLFDAAKRGLDGMIDAARTAGDRGRARELGRLREAMLREVDRLNPDFARARALYRGDAELMDAANTGRDLLNMRPRDFEEAAQEIGRFGDQQQEYLRLGLARDMLDRIANSVDGAEGTRLNRLFQNEQVRGRLRLVLGSEEEFTRFARQMEQEAAIATTNRAINPRAQSQTMPLQEARADLANPPPGPVSAALVDPMRAEGAGLPQAGMMADIISTARADGVSAAPFRLAERLQNARAASGVERNAGMVAPYFFETDPNRRQKLAEALIARALRDWETRAMTEPLARALMRGAPVAGGLAAGDQ
jgi:hypothetical protein